jgi:hypothetical protein
MRTCCKENPLSGQLLLGTGSAAAQIGFVNRDPEPDIEIKQTLGRVVMMTMRAPVQVARRFKAFCKANRLSYWEGIEALMNRAGAG